MSGYSYLPPEYRRNLPTFTPYQSEADKDRSGTRYTLGGVYVWGEVDWFAYATYLDDPDQHGMLWWDLSANMRDEYREKARVWLAELGDEAPSPEDFN